MGEEVFLGLEQPGKIYYDVNGKPYSRSAINGDYYGMPFDNVNVIGISPLIGYMIADRFNNLVLPRSPFLGYDIISDMKESGLTKNDFLYVAKDVRLKALNDSTFARLNRGDNVAAGWAMDESDYVNDIGSVGCITSATTPYVQMFGPLYLYYSNKKLYDDTKEGKSPYLFVILGLNWKNSLTAEDPDRPGYRMIDRVRVGDIISGIDDEGGGHAQMIVGLEKDKNGRVTSITIRLNAGGLYDPLFMSDYKYSLNGSDNPFRTHDRTYVYRIANSDVIDKYVQEHPEEVEHAKKKYPQAKRYGGRLIPIRRWY